MKKCHNCGLEKPVEDFSKNASRKDGRNATCKSCYSVYKKEYYKLNDGDIKEKVGRRREDLREWFDSYKTNLKCEKCGENHPAVLDFHHTGDKDFEIGDAVRNGLSKIKILAEIQKCQVLCCRCHRILHWEERQLG